MELLDKTQARIQNGNNQAMLEGICEDLTSAVKTGVLIVDAGGSVIHESQLAGESFRIPTKNTDTDRIIDPQTNDALRQTVELNGNVDAENMNLSGVSKNVLKKYVFAVSPLCAMGSRIGTALYYRTGGIYGEDELLQLQIHSILASLILCYSKNEITARKNRRVDVVRSAINTLSYSELGAMNHIMDELGNNEGLVVASKIADRAGITRSVIVNALRKLESAGVLESRSLGMKGTYIKVLNDLLAGELKKRKP